MLNFRSKTKLFYLKKNFSRTLQINKKLAKKIYFIFVFEFVLNFLNVMKCCLLTIQSQQFECYC
jgi:hypothetical protein